MSLRRVRCPHCSRLYDVTGVSAGTQLRCACSVLLRVPAWPAPRRIPIFRIAAVAAVVVVTLAILAMTLRPGPAPAAALTAAAASGASAVPASATDDLGFVDDPVARLKQELLVEFPGSTFAWSVRSRPFLVALEASARVAGGGWTDDVEQALELATTVFRREVSERLQLSPIRDTVLPVLVLASRESFDRYCDRRGRRHGPDVKGFYEYSRQRMVTYRGQVPRGVLLHEAVHQLVHCHLRRETQNRPVAVTYWMQEGLGCYVEPFRLRVDGEVGADPRLDREWLPMLQQVLSRPDRAEYVPLARLTGMTVDGIFDAFGAGKPDESADALREAKFCYAESWALVHFLRQGGPRHRRVFDAYLRRELAGTASREVFERLVREELGLEPAQFEAQFIDYVRSLR